MNLYTIIKEVRLFAQAKGLNVVFEDDCPCPRTNGKTMWVPKPHEGWSEDEMINWRCSVLHEAGHNDPRVRDCFTLAESLNLDMQSFLGVGLNLIDDNRNEKLDCDLLVGKRYVMDKGNLLTGQRNLDKGLYNPSDDKKMHIIQTLVLWDYEERSNWLPSVGHIYSQHKAIADAQQLEWLEKLQPYSSRLATLKTAREEWELLLEVLKNVFGWTDEQVEQEKQQSCQKKSGQGKGKGGEQSGDEDTASGESSQEGDGGEGEGEAVEGTVKYSDILKHKHGEYVDGDKYVGLTITYEDSDYDNGGHFVIDPDPQVIDYTKKIIGENTYSQKANENFSSYSFAGKLKRLLQVRAQSLDVHGLKKGKFDRKNIHRATMTQANGYSERIFKETIDNHTLDRAVSVLVDCSGSMGGDKYIHAMRSAALLNESLGKLNIPFDILGFTEKAYDDHALFAVFKDMNKKITTDVLLKNMGDMGGKMNSNADGEAILWAENRLSSRPEKGKLLIVLSDGQPSSDRGDCYRHTIDTVKRIEKERKIDIIGVGIMDSTVRSIYKHSKTINDSAELEHTVINVLKEYII